MRPMATTVPTAVCDIAPNNSEAATVVTASEPRHAADNRHDHGDDAPRDAALRHDLAGQHEERHGQQRKIIQAAEHVGLDGLGRHVGDTVSTATIEVTSRMRKIGKPRMSSNDRQAEKDEIAHRRRPLMRSAGAAGAAGAAPPTHDKPDRDQQPHQGVADRHHRLRDDQRKIRRLAALVEGRKIG